jgi:hypothetical protein
VPSDLTDGATPMETNGFVARANEMYGVEAPEKKGVCAGIFGPERLDNRYEPGATSQKIMAMNGDWRTEKPSLMGNVPPVFLLNCVCDFICVKPFSPRTEQAHFD